MKSILMSIQPKWCELITSGKKTNEVRKTAPKETPFKVYMYCTQAKTRDDFLYIFTERNRKYLNLTAVKVGASDVGGANRANGKVIGEFVCDRIKTFTSFLDTDGRWEYYYVQQEHTCLPYKEFREYGNGKTLYGLHISQLKIYDEPKELRQFRKVCNSAPTAKCYPDNCDLCPWNTITRPPQSWCYVDAC